MTAGPFKPRPVAAPGIGREPAGVGARVTKRELLGSGAAAAGLALAAGDAAGATKPVRYGAIVALGDSLTDNGNAGRYSDGPVWVERMAGRLGLPLAPARLGGTNHAVGGSRALGGPADLRAQLAAYLAPRGRKADSAALHVVWAGANDLLLAFLAPDRERAARDAATAVGEVAGGLAAAGATHLLVPNLPDIGRTPLVRLQGPAAAAEALLLTRAFNAALGRALDAAERRERRVRLTRLDVFALAGRVEADPAALGFRDVLNPCQGSGAAGGCEGFLFWDQIHPTAYAHARLAEAALRQLGVEVAPGDLDRRGG